MTKPLEPEVIKSNPLPDVNEPQTSASGSASGVYYPSVIPQIDFPTAQSALNVVGTNLDTQARVIKGSFTFNQLGAIKIGNYVSGSSGDVSISPNGIVGRNSSGATTFSIDGTTGDATFKGTVSSGSVISAEISANIITSGTLNASVVSVTNLNASNITSGSINASVITITNLNASNISTGTLSASRIGSSSITADKLSVSTLSAISANLGTITAGTITGATLRTAASGKRIVIDTSNTITIYDASGNNTGSISGSGGQLVLDTAGGNIYLSGDVSCDGFLGTDTFSCNAMAGNISFGGFDATNIDELKGGDGYIDMNSGHSNTETHNLDPTSSGSYNLGGSSRYWNYVNCVDVSYHSMGFYDRGVTLQDGTKVSDVEAIKQIKPHPTQTTPLGVPLIDKKSLPVEMYIAPKDDEGNPLPFDDKKGEFYIMEKQRDMEEEVKRFVPNAEGESGAQLLALLLGAVKELDVRISALEAK